MRVAACNGDGWFWTNSAWLAQNCWRSWNFGAASCCGTSAWPSMTATEKSGPLAVWTWFWREICTSCHPPKETFLGDIPWDLLAGRKSTRQAPGYQGQTLLWGSPTAGMQGVAELVRCERIQDAWLAEFQGQLRHGQLSDDNHKFLHGKPTTVPGSWITGYATCQRPVCAALITQGLSPEAIQLAECGHMCDWSPLAYTCRPRRCGQSVSERVQRCSCNLRHKWHQISRQQGPRPPMGKCPRTPTVFICSTRSCFGSGPPRKAESDGREIAVVAATRQGMRWAVWRLAAVRGHACSGHTPRPQAWNPERHQGLCSRLVCDCRCDTCTRRNGVQQPAGRGIREVWHRHVVANIRCPGRKRLPSCDL